MAHFLEGCGIINFFPFINIVYNGDISDEPCAGAFDLFEDMSGNLGLLLSSGIHILFSVLVYDEV